MEINDENNCMIFDKDIKYINNFYNEEEIEEDNMIRGKTQLTNNIPKMINPKIQMHFLNVLKHRTNQ